MTQQDQQKVPTPPEQISAVNRLLLGAFISGCTAFFIWPDTPWWWGLYPISVMLGAASLSLTSKAIVKVHHIHKFERDQALFTELGGEVKQARLADTDVFKRKGVIRHVKR
ncbi:MAG: hypothetical protein ACE37E_11215 [Hyphomicrobiales bacterium]